jgi:electron-transferring-flavoprotein dehydrogenase
MNREVMEYDVVIVGAGPSGLSAAIKLRQISEKTGSDILVSALLRKDRKLVLTFCQELF